MYFYIKDVCVDKNFIFGNIIVFLEFRFVNRDKNEDYFLFGFYMYCFDVNVLNDLECLNYGMVVYL